jgi:(4-O-methyl)-D-glucuronate---lignin esterase
MSAPWLRSTLVLCAFIGLVFATRPFARDGDQAKDSAAPKPPVVLTNQEDRQRMLDQLKISGIPPSPGAYLAATYDEKTANPYPNLPDPLLMNDGTKVTTPAQWRKRRAEIVELFDREVYGRRPKVMPKVTWEVVSTTNGMTGNVAVVTKQLVGHVDNSAYPLVTVNILASLSTPANAKGPVPVVLMFGGGAPPANGPAQSNPCVQPGAPARGAAPPAAARGGAPLAGRGALPAAAGPPEPSAPEQIVGRGWGYATINSGSVQADCGAGLTVGIIGLVNKGQPRKLDDWGVLSAWGWGMSKVLDYFETDKAVDAKKVAVQGHSRAGKAALVAMAYDERFLTGFISSSGESGAKLHRRKYGELIENIAALNEYHWMAGNFLKYTGRWDQLPVDSHELVALCAPRPVFLSAGKGPDENPDGTVKMMDPSNPGIIMSRGPVEQQAANINDAWVDAKGTFLAGVGAGPVYRLLGKKDLGTTEFPKIEMTLINGDIGFRQHSAGHTPGPNWPVFLEFAAKYFDAPAVAPKTVARTR